MSSTINQDIASSISSARINKEKRFQIYGVAALLFAMIMLVTLFITIFSKGLSAFIQTKVNLDIELITPIAMEKELRFAIREGGHTVGAGVVTEIKE